MIESWNRLWKLKSALFENVTIMNNFSKISSKFEDRMADEYNHNPWRGAKATFLNKMIRHTELHKHKGNAYILR